MSIYQMQREQIRNKILDTAITIFVEKGYEHTTIEEITRTVGIAKGTFFNYYPSKSEILLAWAAGRFQKFEFGRAFNKDKTVEENMFTFLEILIDAIGDEIQLFKHFLKELFKEYGSGKNSGQYDFISIYHSIINISKDGAGINKSMSDIKADVLNNSLFMGIINWFEADKPVEGLYEYLSSIIKVCLYGMFSNIAKID